MINATWLTLTLREEDLRSCTLANKTYTKYFIKTSILNDIESSSNGLCWLGERCGRSYNHNMVLISLYTAVVADSCVLTHPAETLSPHQQHCWTEVLNSLLNSGRFHCRVATTMWAQDESSRKSQKRMAGCFYKESESQEKQVVSGEAVISRETWCLRSLLTKSACIRMFYK